MTEQGYPVVEVDTSRPHPARMYDYYLGGKDNYEVDREAAQQVLRLFPDAVPTALANRAFMRRAVRFIVESGIRQIIDIGTGIPTVPNTHQVAHQVASGVRVAYVDNDPSVAAHSAAQPPGAAGTGFFLADVRDPEGILKHPTVGELIDFDQPVGLMLAAVLHFVGDEEDPAGLVAAYRDALPAGSHLVLSHVTADFHPAEAGSGQAGEVYRRARAATTLTPRTYERVLALFDGFDLVEPGLVQAPLWRPGYPPPGSGEVAHVGMYAGVGVRN